MTTLRSASSNVTRRLTPVRSRLGERAGRQRIVRLRSRAPSASARTTRADCRAGSPSCRAACMHCAQRRQQALGALDALVVEIAEEAAREADVRSDAHRQVTSTLVASTARNSFAVMPASSSVQVSWVAIKARRGAQSNMPGCRFHKVSKLSPQSSPTLGFVRQETVSAVHGAKT